VPTVLFLPYVEHPSDPLPQRAVRLPEEVRERHTVDAFAWGADLPKMSAPRARTAERFFREGDSPALRQGEQAFLLGKLVHNRCLRPPSDLYRRRAEANSTKSQSGNVRILRILPPDDPHSAPHPI